MQVGHKVTSNHEKTRQIRVNSCIFGHKIAIFLGHNVISPCVFNNIFGSTFIFLFLRFRAPWREFARRASVVSSGFIRDIVTYPLADRGIGDQPVRENAG